MAETDDNKVIVLGSGMAGMAAAASLRQAGLNVLVIDKGSVPGGRVASRKIGPAIFDHGLQHFHAETSPFAASLAEWQSGGLIAPWSARAPVVPSLGRHPRPIGVANHPR